MHAYPFRKLIALMSVFFACFVCFECSPASSRSGRTATSYAVRFGSDDPYNALKAIATDIDNTLKSQPPNHQSRRRLENLSKKYNELADEFQKNKIVTGPMEKYYEAAQHEKWADENLKEAAQQEAGSEAAKEKHGNALYNRNRASLLRGEEVTEIYVPKQTTGPPMFTSVISKPNASIPGKNNSNADVATNNANRVPNVPPMPSKSTSDSGAKPFTTTPFNKRNVAIGLGTLAATSVLVCGLIALFRYHKKLEQNKAHNDA